MIIRAVVPLALWSLGVWPMPRAVEAREPQMAAAQPQVESHASARARARITVQGSEVRPYDHSANPALSEVQLHERFTGDLVGESPVRALRVSREDRSASLVSIQRFRGTLGGRKGTFVLQGSEVVDDRGRIRATWSVVPGSGTEDLVGLRGEGGFEGEFGRGSDGTLDYWFE